MFCIEDRQRHFPWISKLIDATLLFFWCDLLAVKNRTYLNTLTIECTRWRMQQRRGITLFRCIYLRAKRILKDIEREIHFSLLASSQMDICARTFGCQRLRLDVRGMRFSSFFIAFLRIKSR